MLGALATTTRSDEIARLRGCISSFASVFALPAIWSRGGSQQIVSSLLEALLRLLDLDFAYASLAQPGDGLPLETLRCPQAEASLDEARASGEALRPWVADRAQPAALSLPNPLGRGEVRVARFGLGLTNELGWVVAASRRPDFPNELERLSLGVAVNQAALGLHEARGRGDESGRLFEVVGAVRDMSAEKLAFDEIWEPKDRLPSENVVLREEVQATSTFAGIVGASPALTSVLARLSKVAPTDATVLITGQTGTGKELIARAIHQRSARAGQAFVAVNCAAIPPALIASELFGHEKGAFTGALRRHAGRFELAHGGTLYLDEIGELPSETQLALLRVLQESEFERVGGTQPIRCDVRLVAATNRDLGAAIEAGRFRSDLFYRINVFPIEMPPLRARREDIPMLAEHFIHRYAEKLGKRIQGIRKKSLDLLVAYDWPGNIRELQNIIERSVILCESDTLSVDPSWVAGEPARRELAPVSAKIGNDFRGMTGAAPADTRGRVSEPNGAAVRPRMPASEKIANDLRAMIEGALAETRGRVSGPSGAAVRLGMPASTLESKIRALGIDKGLFRLR